MVYTVENTNPQSFTDVKVFTGDNFYPASDATYKNLIWENIGGGRPARPGRTARP